jgi:hypothetical protein
MIREAMIHTRSQDSIILLNLSDPHCSNKLYKHIGTGFYASKRLEDVRFLHLACHFTDRKAHITDALEDSASQLKEFQSHHKALQASYLEEPAEAIVLETTTNLAYDLVEHIKKERKAKQL